jgi:serine/threonine protein kinase/tetratricopeptide (TPR) repeat protein
VKDVFLAVVDLPSSERPAALDRLCEGDADLRARVERMLAADQDAESFLGSPAALGFASLADDGAPLPATIGPYRVESRIGEGGFGVVYRAVQESPIRRTVAVKLVKPGMDSRRVIARFEAERRTLARLQHPNIAQIFDAGSTADGRPYVAMELIDGVPITRWCDDRTLDVDARIALAFDVCAAVEHAHQKGVVHRDIKPSNVLVHQVGGTTIVKVIDFGIAKLLDADPDSQALTLESQFVGTPDYMSPEQVDSSLGDVDTRVDIFALGVLLHELLVGTTPHRLATRTSSLSETLRLIRDAEPSRPSAVFEGLGARRDEIAAARSTDAKRLHRHLRGDLDWIILKAIDRDRSRRYASVGALAADLRRHRAHEPVAAVRSGAWYVLGKFMRRHRVAVGVGAITTTALVAGLGVATASYLRVLQAEAAAKVDRNETLAMNEFLVEDVLGAARPSRAGYQVTVLDAMATALGNIDLRLADDPVVAARLKASIGNVYRTVGRYAEAKTTLESAAALFEREFGPLHAGAIEARLASAMVDVNMDDNGGAEAILREILPQAIAAFGEDHLVTLRVKSSYGDVLQRAGRHAEAESMLLDVVTRPSRLPTSPEDDYRFAALAAMVASLSAQGRHPEAMPFAKGMVEEAARLFPPTHPAGLASRNNYAAMLFNEGRYADAAAMYAALLADVEATQPPGHWQIAIARFSLARSVARAGDPERARGLMATAVQEAIGGFGPEHSMTERFQGDYADLLRSLGDKDELPALFEAVATRLRVANPDQESSVVAAFRSYRERSGALRGDASDATAVDELEARGRMLVAERAKLGPRYLANLGIACLESGLVERAELLLVEAEAAARSIPEASEDIEAIERRRARVIAARTPAGS